MAMENTNAQYWREKIARLKQAAKDASTRIPQSTDEGWEGENPEDLSAAQAEAQTKKRTGQATMQQAMQGSQGNASGGGGSGSMNQVGKMMGHDEGGKKSTTHQQRAAQMIGPRERQASLQRGESPVFKNRYRYQRRF